MSKMHFTKKDFSIMQTEGLENRMSQIREHIQPVFSQLADSLAEDLSTDTGEELFIHVARHARRSVHPPESTWFGIAPDKRGYKKHPHFQVGLFDDHLFAWLTHMYEVPDKAGIGSMYLDRLSLLTSLPDDYKISPDHTKPDAFYIQENQEKTIHTLERLRDVKKAELLIGRQFDAKTASSWNEKETYEYIYGTFKELLPLYHLSLQTV
ncbi:YktB family protein [Marinococcus halophilus]|uniref:UPF0637 protein MHA01_01730 n=1 Tax=Marinococcus halophilus TaxID=1371 RepID=A0A510Y1S6_MARHA|nr:DUF1054 domain-containing protein [Marinococcus halophilus]GEK57268.1 UPF0637 protein [Marinococcus halophilus]